MAEQDPTQALAAPQGPFTAQIMEHRLRQPQRQASGWESPLGLVGMLASRWSEGVAEGRLANILKEEMSNRQALNVYLSEAQRLLSDPNALTREGREAIAQKYQSVLASLIDSGDKGKSAKADGGIGGVVKGALKIGLQTLMGGELPQTNIGKIDLKREIGELQTLAAQHSAQRVEQELGERLSQRIHEILAQNPYATQDQVASDPTVSQLISQSMSQLGRVPASVTLALQSLRKRGKPEEEVLYGMLGSEQAQARPPQETGAQAPPAPPPPREAAAAIQAQAETERAPSGGSVAAWNMALKNNFVVGPIEVKTPTGEIKNALYVNPGAFGIPQGYYDASTLERLPDATLQFKRERPFTVDLVDEKTGQPFKYFITSEGQIVPLGRVRDPYERAIQREEAQERNKALGYLASVQRQYSNNLARIEDWRSRALAAAEMKNISTLQALGVNVNLKAFQENVDEAVKATKRTIEESAYQRRRAAEEQRRKDIEFVKSLFSGRFRLEGIEEAEPTEEERGPETEPEPPLPAPRKTERGYQRPIITGRELLGR